MDLYVANGGEERVEILSYYSADNYGYRKLCK